MDISKIQINNVNYNLKDASAIASGIYDSSSQKIVFKNKDNVVVCQIDATPFIVDGMVSNVAVSNGNLVITFNTDAGKSPISIPLTDIFNPAEYYTKIGYFVCDTAANTAAKTINAAGFVLSTGGSIKIKMTNDNTANNATLNINSTGAKPLYYAGLRASSDNTWESGETIEVYYDGTNYMANNVAGGGGDGVFDVSAKTGDTYESLSAALTAMDALPSAYKKGGMSIKYIQSSDNNSVYVQYRLMTQNFTTDTSKWQGVDDKPTNGSVNLVQSGGVAESTGRLVRHYTINSGSTHSSQADKIDVDIKTGELFFVMVSVSGTVYANPGTSDVNLGNVSANRYYRFTAAQDITSIGVYNPQQSSTVTVTFEVLVGLAAIAYNTTIKDTEPIVGSNNFITSGGVAKMKMHMPYISFVGIGDTFKPGDVFSDLLPGHKVRIYMGSTSWNYGTTNTVAFVFRIILTINGAEQYPLGNNYYYRSGLVLPEYFDVDIPSTFVNGRDSLHIGGRAAQGVEVGAIIEDTTYYNTSIVPVQNNISALQGKTTNCINDAVHTIPSWASNKSYALGDFVVYDNNFYSCHVAHTSGSTFESANFFKWNLRDIIEKDAPMAQICKKTSSSNYYLHRIGSYAIPFNFHKNHTYRFIIEGLNGERQVAQIQARTKYDQSSDGGIVTLLSNKGDGTYDVKYTNDVEGIFINVVLSAQSNTEIPAVCPTIFMYDITAVADVVSSVQSIEADMPDVMEQVDKTIDVYTFIGNIPTQGGTATVNRDITVEQGKRYAVKLTDVVWTADNLSTAYNVFYIVDMNGTTPASSAIPGTTFNRPSDVPSDGIIRFVPGTNKVRICYRGDVGSSMVAATVKRGSLTNTVDDIDDAVDDIEKDMQYVSNQVGGSIDVYDFKGNIVQSSYEPTVDHDITVEQGKEYVVMLAINTWTTDNMKSSTNVFYIRNMNGTTQGSAIAGTTFNRPSNIPSDGIRFVPGTNKIRMCFRGDVGSLVTANTIKCGPIASFVNAASNQDVVSLNGGLQVLTNKFKNLSKRRGSNGDSNAGNKILNLLYFSDLHNGQSSLQRLLGFADTFDTYIDDVVHGGDMVSNLFSDTNPFAVLGGSKVLTVIGNHDNWLGSSSMAPQLDVFNKFIKPYYQAWGVTVPSDAETEGYCYWYKDYDESKLRLIGLDCMNWDSTQAAWLSDVLDDAYADGYSVIILNHYCPHTSFKSDRQCTFSTVYVNGCSNFLNSEAAGIVHSKIEGGLKFVVWLFGHEHKDFFGNIETYPEQYALAIDKTSPTSDWTSANPDWERDSIRVSTGRSQDAFDVISVDTTAGILTVMRIGNNTDKFMRQKNYLTFDYVNHKIVGNS